MLEDVAKLPAEAEAEAEAEAWPWALACSKKSRSCLRIGAGERSRMVVELVHRVVEEDLLVDVAAIPAAVERIYVHTIPESSMKVLMIRSPVLTGSISPYLVRVRLGLGLGLDLGNPNRVGGSISPDLRDRHGRPVGRRRRCPRARVCAQLLVVRLERRLPMGCRRRRREESVKASLQVREEEAEDELWTCSLAP